MLLFQPGVLEKQEIRKLGNWAYRSAGQQNLKIHSCRQV